MADAAPNVHADAGPSADAPPTPDSQAGASPGGAAASADAGWASESTPPPERKSGFRVGRSTVVIIVIVGILLVGGFLFRDRLTGNAGDIQVGDCFMVPVASETESEQQIVEEVDHKPCDEPHDAEAFFVGDLEGGTDAPFPEGSVVDDFVGAQCLPAFLAYTGTDLFEQENLDAGYFSPTPESWRLADREVMCYLTPIDGSTTTQSYRVTAP
jgi:hypothetical protein